MGYPELTDAELTEVISERAVVNQVSATGEYQVVAIDVAEPWAAVFRFSLSTSGDVDTETDIAELRADRSWASCVGGGIRSRGWEVPWRRPDTGWWQGDHLITFGWCGMDVEDDIEVVAVSGFVSANADALRVTTPGSQRLVSPSATGAFVAVGRGRGFDYMKLTPLSDGLPLGHDYSFPAPR